MTTDPTDNARTFLASPSPERASFHAQPPRSSPNASLIASLRIKGYCIAPAFFSKDRVARLHSAASYATELARSDRWPHLRTLPKQFPPWRNDAKDGIWGVQHLLHPDMLGRNEFARCYFDPELLALCESLMRDSDNGGSESAPSGKVEEGEQLVMELFNLLVRPDRDFELRWHRDSVPFDDIDVEEEAKRLGLHDGRTRVPYHVQYNIPLCKDASLVLAPGSHLRPRSKPELELLKDPYVKELPDMLVVELEPGDVVFYDNNLIHRGVYEASTERLTLHGSVGDVRGGAGRASNVLQHAVGEYIERCSFSDLGNGESEAGTRAEAMRRRLVELGQAANAKDTQAIHAD